MVGLQLCQNTPVNHGGHNQTGHLRSSWTCFLRRFFWGRVRDGLWFEDFLKFLYFVCLGEKIWPGLCSKLIFYSSSGSLFLGYYQNVQCLGGKYMWGKRRLQHFQVNLSWDKPKAIWVLKNHQLLLGSQTPSDVLLRIRSFTCPFSQPWRRSLQ